MVLPRHPVLILSKFGSGLVQPRQSFEIWLIAGNFEPNFKNITLFPPPKLRRDNTIVFSCIDRAVKSSLEIWQDNHLYNDSPLPFLPAIQTSSKKDPQSFLYPIDITTVKILHYPEIISHHPLQTSRNPIRTWKDLNEVLPALWAPLSCITGI